MISQMSAAPSPLSWNEVQEMDLPNAYLFDAVIAVRSDLTFFMNVRGWLNINYGNFVAARNDNQDLVPLVSGFVLLSVREKRFLAHLASNPDGHLGTTDYPLNPPLSSFLVSALRNSQISATLLIEPGPFAFTTSFYAGTFETAKTTKQEIVHAITAGAVNGRAAGGEKQMSSDGAASLKREQ